MSSRWDWLGLVGWLDGWMVGWLDGWMVGWLDGWMVGWLCRESWRECPSHEDLASEDVPATKWRQDSAIGVSQWNRLA
ncbi:hypothetical protein RISK_006781 [Rhodopirellula islandica]|uniref:Uncharacterized protein n=1 Tax=Rhodopirellula islandica TaxID=595434 RepID=A0A0J1B360_RHOIS|nr:hypothetical protein RISK_006781 [Rhodopirellula islandica]